MAVRIERVLLTGAGAIAAYVAAWLLWMLVLYLNIMPLPASISILASSLVAPLILPIVFVAWSMAHAAAPQRDGALRLRRLIQLAVAAAGAALVEMIHMLTPQWFGDAVARNKPVGAAVSLLLMGAIALTSLIKDRDIDTALLLLMITLCAVVPAVIAGRLLAQGLLGVLSSFSL